MTSVVPQHLGFGHIEHDAFVEKHTTPIAKELFTTDNNEAVLILDGTYLYIQKSSDYKFQRQSYSLHKNRPLVKPMMVVASDGYILSVLGPYLADYGNNDANITKHVLNNNLEEIRSWLRKDDVFIVDRGFRDAVEYLEGIGLKVEMLSYLAKGARKEDGDLSDAFNKVRWVVESTNGRLKQFRFFDRVMPNTFVPHIGDLVKVKQAASYTKEHMDGEGYEMMICRDLPDLLKVNIQSRHSKNASHTLWVQYSSGEMRGWYCTCKVGARVVGCCAHVASVLWYLGYKRHTETAATKESLSSVFLNADTASGSFSRNDPLEE